MKKQITRFLLALIVIGVYSQPASAVELIANGGFEGGLASWVVSDQAGGSGTWSVDDGDGLSPLSSLATVGPAAGLFYGASDQFGPGAHALEQLFVVPTGSTSVILKFNMFVNDMPSTGGIVNPAGLDYTSGGTSAANQHARVDILNSVTGPFNTGAGVLANLYLGVDAGPNPHAYTAYSFDITSVVGAGGTFRVRFAEVDNQGNFIQGVDNVSINAVPEPASIALACMAIVGLAVVRVRRGTQ